MSEIWKDIIGYEGIYQISSLGKVKSLGRITEHKRLKMWTVKGKEMTFTKTKKGYYAIALCKLGCEKQKYLHVLLAQHFIPNPNNYKLVRHLDDDRGNNSLENLAWGTYQDNTNDMIRNGTQHKGETSICSKVILDTKNGIYYYGTVDACNAIGMKRSTLIAQLNGQNKNRTSLIYV